jgi:hypothetical protein
LKPTNNLVVEKKNKKRPKENGRQALAIEQRIHHMTNELMDRIQDIRMNHRLM